MIGSLDELRDRLRLFAHARQWGKYHSPKNLSMALVAEVGELVEHFQWKTEAESAQLTSEEQRAIAHELADVLLYLVQLADRLDVDLLRAAEDKLALNEIKYPPSENSNHRV